MVINRVRMKKYGPLLKGSGFFMRPGVVAPWKNGEKY